MTAREFYNSKAIKHQLRRAIKQDKKYFEDSIIELMELYAQEKIKEQDKDATLHILAGKLNKRQIHPDKDQDLLLEELENAGFVYYEEDDCGWTFEASD